MIRVLGKDSGSNFALSGEGDNTSGPLHEEEQRIYHKQFAISYKSQVSGSR